MTDLENANLFLEVIPVTMRMIRTEIRKTAGKEFTIPQFRLLAKISREPSSNQDLAEWMGVRPPTMSIMIRTLVSRKLVQREINPRGNDRRQVRLSTTKRGMATAKRIRAAAQKALALKIGLLTETEKAVLVGALKTLKEHFK